MLKEYKRTSNDTIVESTLLGVGRETWGLRRSLARRRDLLNLSLTLGTPALRVSGQGNDEQRELPIARSVQSRSRGDGPERLSFRALRCADDGVAGAERFKSSVKVWRSLARSGRRGGPRCGFGSDSKCYWLAVGGVRPATKQNDDLELTGINWGGLIDKFACLEFTSESQSPPQHPGALRAGADRAGHQAPLTQGFPEAAFGMGDIGQSSSLPLAPNLEAVKTPTKKGAAVRYKPNRRNSAFERPSNAKAAKPRVMRLAAHRRPRHQTIHHLAVWLARRANQDAVEAGGRVGLFAFCFGVPPLVCRLVMASQTGPSEFTPKHSLPVWATRRPLNPDFEQRRDLGRFDLNSPVSEVLSAGVLKLNGLQSVEKRWCWKRNCCLGRCARCIHDRKQSRSTLEPLERAPRQPEVKLASPEKLLQLARFCSLTRLLCSLWATARSIACGQDGGLLSYLLRGARPAHSALGAERVRPPANYRGEYLATDSSPELHDVKSLATNHVDAERVPVRVPDKPGDSIAWTEKVFVLCAAWSLQRASFYSLIADDDEATISADTTWWDKSEEPAGLLERRPDVVTGAELPHSALGAAPWVAARALVKRALVGCCTGLVWVACKMTLWDKSGRGGTGDTSRTINHRRPVHWSYLAWQTSFVSIDPHPTLQSQSGYCPQLPSHHCGPASFAAAVSGWVLEPEGRLAFALHGVRSSLPSFSAGVFMQGCRRLVDAQRLPHIDAHSLVASRLPVSPYCIPASALQQLSAARAKMACKASAGRSMQVRATLPVTFRSHVHLEAPPRRPKIQAQVFPRVAVLGTSLSLAVAFLLSFRLTPCRPRFFCTSYSRHNKILESPFLKISKKINFCFQEGVHEWSILFPNPNMQKTDFLKISKRKGAKQCREVMWRNHGEKSSKARGKAVRQSNRLFPGKLVQVFSCIGHLLIVHPQLQELEPHINKLSQHQDIIGTRQRLCAKFRDRDHRATLNSESNLMLSGAANPKSSKNILREWTSPGPTNEDLVVTAWTLTALRQTVLEVGANKVRLRGRRPALSNHEHLLVSDIRATLS
ncbi:uncharacterized protein BDR25DRAFT_357945 [Lindgomyces ingoldianus]|uniref:Uncharacterized protein n=1 Tax=Lindgomyces ingoldianus TaxID=673940 RepID=A0ACB6QNQ0_9PLEO|nr:uncharacterized protein BDR25DRAFT_357945 [Lindgomyces ingoldianus]KAF2468203.1 hypothetical protein BDR25DRAFT_357945 [Lindgomyces ingoldianus]